MVRQSQISLTDVSGHFVQKEDTAFLNARAQISFGTQKRPVLIAGKANDSHPLECAIAKQLISVASILFSSSPSPKRGPTACTIPLYGSLPAVVATAFVTGMRPYFLMYRAQWSSIFGPPSLDMMAAIPPPWLSPEFAGLTMTSTGAPSKSRMPT